MLRIATCYECHRKEAVYLIHIDKDQIDASRVLPLPQTTGMVYHQNDRNAYEVVLTVERLDGTLEGYDGYVIWTYEDGSTAMQDVVIQPPNTIRHAIAPALLAKAGEVSVSLIVYNEADAYRRTLAQWLCRVLPEAQEPAVPPEDPDIPIIQSLLLDAQALRRGVEAALSRAEEVEQGAADARTGAQAAQVSAEAARTGAQAAQTAAEAARDAAATQAATAEGQAAAAVQSAAQASDSAAAAQVARAGAEVAQTGAQSAQAAAEDARDETEAALGSKVPNTRTINGKALNQDVTLTAADVGAQPQTQARSAMVKADANGALVAAEEGSDYNRPVIDRLWHGWKTDTGTIELAANMKDYSAIIVTTATNNIPQFMVNNLFLSIDYISGVTGTLLQLLCNDDARISCTLGYGEDADKYKRIHISTADSNHGVLIVYGIR